MGKFLVGVDGVAKVVKDVFVGVDGVAHKVKTGFIGVDGQARVFFGGYYQPSTNEVIFSINRGQYFNQDTKFAPGVYEIQIAGEPGDTTKGYTNTNCFTIQTTMTEVFQIFAVTSAYDAGTDVLLQNMGITSADGTIFGGRGGKSAGVMPTNSTPWYQGCLTWGGACCHFIPLNGTFGTNYLRCFHCGAPASGTYGGSGAYGGGAGGRGARTASAGTYVNRTGLVGRNGIGGNGGAGGSGTQGNVVGAGDTGNPGSSGAGIGAGTATAGGVAIYNGSTWSEPTRGVNTNRTAYINVIYRGAQ